MDEQYQQFLLMELAKFRSEFESLLSVEDVKQLDQASEIMIDLILIAARNKTLKDFQK